MATALLVIVGAGDVALGIALFAIAHVAHLLAMSLYNSYLPLIAAPSRFARISGLAWGLSYLGSIACYLLRLPFTRDGLAPGNAANFTGAFAVAAVFLALIGLPAVLGLPRDAAKPSARDAPGPYRRIAGDDAPWRHDRNVPRFLLAYYLVNDGVVTAAFFTALTFRKSYGMDVQEILALTLLLQLVAIPATIFFGWLGGRWSQRGATNVALVLWIAVLFLMATAHGRNGAIAVTMALGLVLGSTQSLFRSMFAALVPVDRASEYFGFHTLMGRASAALGPLAFGIVSAATGSQRDRDGVARAVLRRRRHGAGVRYDSRHVTQRDARAPTHSARERSISMPISRTPGNAPSFATRTLTHGAPNSISTSCATSCVNRSSSGAGASLAKATSRPTTAL